MPPSHECPPEWEKNGMLLSLFPVHNYVCPVHSHVDWLIEAVSIPACFLFYVIIYEIYTHIGGYHILSDTCLSHALRLWFFDCVCLCVCVCVYVCMNTHTYGDYHILWDTYLTHALRLWFLDTVCVCLCVYLFTCVCVCMYVCMCIFICTYYMFVRHMHAYNICIHIAYAYMQNKNVYIHAHTRICTHACICAYARMHIYIHAY